MENTSASLADNLYLTFLKLDEVKSLFFTTGRFGTVFLEGQLAEAVYFVRHGLVKLYKCREVSKTVAVDLASEGELFGEEALAEGTTYSVSAETFPGGASICRIPRAIFLRTRDEHPEFWRCVAESTLAKTRRLEQKVASLGLNDIERRLLQQLTELTGRGGVAQGEQQTIPLSQGELAELIGARRESTTLKGLQRRGLVRLGRRQLGLVMDKQSTRSGAP
jgi:CRP-like cAMP-binding protein